MINGEFVLKNERRCELVEKEYEEGLIEEEKLELAELENWVDNNMPVKMDRILPKKPKKRY
jgi:hypothetical protein